MLDADPLAAIKWKAPKVSSGVDRQVVINPEQAAALLSAVSEVPTSGPRLVAFFACMYYAALRPEEAANLRVGWLDIPEDDGWGWVGLEAAAPEIDKQWGDGDGRRQSRELKHRARGESRRVPLTPVLVAMIREHMAAFPPDAEGRLFTGEQGAPVSGVTYRRVWDRARRKALTPEQYDSPLAQRPYDLRHAAVSTWLNSGVGPTRVAAWAGHRVDVLLRIYAKCLDGQEQLDLQRISEALQPICPGRRRSDAPSRQG